MAVGTGRKQPTATAYAEKQGYVPYCPPAPLGRTRSPMSRAPERRVWTILRLLPGALGASLIPVFSRLPCSLSHSRTEHVRFSRGGALSYFQPQISSGTTPRIPCSEGGCRVKPKSPKRRMAPTSSGPFFQKACARLRFYGCPLCQEGVLQYLLTFLFTVGKLTF